MNVDPKIQFQRECDAKFWRGVREYRGGDATLPFVGDLIDEYCQEQLDSVNYLMDELRNGRISVQEFDYAFGHHFELWWWAKGRADRGVA